jgi:hypothetical protein
MNIFVNSADRVAGKPNDYFVTLPPGTFIPPEYTKVAVLSVAQRGSLYNISIGKNRFYSTVVVYTNTATAPTYYPFTTELTPGYYLQDDLTAALASKITSTLASTLPSLPAISVSITHDVIHHAFTITVNTAQYRGGAYAGGYLWWQPSDGTNFNLAKLYDGSLNEVMGMESLSYPTVGAGLFTPYINSASLAYSSSTMHKLDDEQTLFLCSDLVPGALLASTTLTPNIMCSVVHPTFGNLGLNEFLAPIVHNISGRYIDSFRVFWRAASGAEVDFNGVDHVIQLQFST